jgi:carbon storage regulator
LEWLFGSKGGLTLLVLTRKPGEKVIIDRDIVVTIVAVRGNKVRVGIEAPKDKVILREEISDEPEGSD